MTSCCPRRRMRWGGATGAIARCKNKSTGCARRCRSVHAWHWICGVKPTPKVVNKPSPHSIVHGLDKPGVFTTVSILGSFFLQTPLDLPASGTCTFLSSHIAEGGTAMERPLTVGQLARATGVPAKTIRYYEQVGILPMPKRSGAGYRHYSRHDVHRLLFIRRARALGLSLANLKALTAELDSGECLTMRPRLHV